MPDTLPAWKTHLPNALTLARVVLAGVVFALISVGIGPPDATRGLTGDAVFLIIAASLFVVAALTDALDGYFARRWKVISPFGRVMDPFADKILVLGAFVCLAGSDFQSPSGVMLSGIAPWMVVIILARELLVTTIRGVYESAGVDFSANWAGKAKMVLQSGVVPGILLILALSPAVPGSGARVLIVSMVWMTVAVTIWSGVPYVGRAIRSSREMRNKTP